MGKRGFLVDQRWRHGVLETCADVRMSEHLGRQFDRPVSRASLLNLGLTGKTKVLFDRFDQQLQSFFGLVGPQRALLSLCLPKFLPVFFDRSVEHYSSCFPTVLKGYLNEILLRYCITDTIILLGLSNRPGGCCDAIVLYCITIVVAILLTDRASINVRSLLPGF